ncbi:MAG: hypothetical protein IT371_10690 [Deltaproteobacteria bacterium]|nr:hypothetical protein [Deltaproteobacteria bacterium]
MSFRVLFTSDYEIHGSGRGSARELMVEPTDRMLDQFDRYGAKLTILADVAEILKFKEYAERYGRDDFAYQDIVRQLRRAVATGHDVQLHMHSSYFKATYGEGYWRQSYDEYDLANLPYERLSALIKLGREFLEEALRPVRPSYRCFAFRAANWSMHPSTNIVRALVENGITIDTSVFKWGKYDELVKFDYTDAHSDLVPWPVAAHDVCRRDPAGELFEFPIYCEQKPIWTFLTPNRVYRVVQQRLNPLPENAEEPAHDGGGGVAALPGKLVGAAGMLLRRHAWKMDFNQCTGRQLVDGLKRVERKYGGLPYELPVVLIGHSKTFTRHNERSLKPFLEYVAERGPRLRFGTFGDFDLRVFRTVST